MLWVDNDGRSIMYIAQLRRVAGHHAGVAVAPFYAIRPQTRPSKDRLVFHRKPSFGHLLGLADGFGIASSRDEAAVIWLYGPALPECGELIEAGIVDWSELGGLLSFSSDHDGKAPSHLLEDHLTVVKTHNRPRAFRVDLYRPFVEGGASFGAKEVEDPLCLAAFCSIAHPLRVGDLDEAVKVMAMNH